MASLLQLHQQLYRQFTPINVLSLIPLHCKQCSWHNSRKRSWEVLNTQHTLSFLLNDCHCSDEKPNEDLFYLASLLLNVYHHSCVAWTFAKLFEKNIIAFAQFLLELWAFGMCATFFDNPILWGLEGAQDIGKRGSVHTASHIGLWPRCCFVGSSLILSYFKFKLRHLFIKFLHVRKQSKTI